MAYMQRLAAAKLEVGRLAVPMEAAARALRTDQHALHLAGELQRVLAQGGTQGLEALSAIYEVCAAVQAVAWPDMWERDLVASTKTHWGASLFLRMLVWTRDQAGQQHGVHLYEASWFTCVHGVWLARMYLASLEAHGQAVSMTPAPARA